MVPPFSDYWWYTLYKVILCLSQELPGIVEPNRLPSSITIWETDTPIDAQKPIFYLKTIWRTSADINIYILK